MNCTFITEKNIHIFEGLLPETAKPGGRRLLFGAYDSEGFALGTIAGTYLDDECSIDWLYVLPAARQCGVATALLQCLMNTADDPWYSF